MPCTEGKSKKSINGEESEGGDVEKGYGASPVVFGGGRSGGYGGLKFPFESCDCGCYGHYQEEAHMQSCEEELLRTGGEEYVYEPFKGDILIGG